MGDVNHIVDHLKLEYRGIFSVREMFRMFTRWYKESPYEKGGDYISEQNTSHGKCIEYYYFPWKKQTDAVRYFMRIRMLIYDLKKVDVMADNNKKTMDHGRIIIYLDGFVEYDYESRWQHTAFLQFIRTLYIKFLFKNYSKFHERLIIDDCHHIYDMFERFFNMYRSYKPVKKMPHWFY
ncbi:hypothetical protein GF323_02485 [Candidatus Woesearchaeota archaeon]|nr:hypothetical protein [Candidatus Woesearchaeota archaeon]